VRLRVPAVATRVVMENSGSDCAGTPLQHPAHPLTIYGCELARFYFEGILSRVSHSIR
jgi:hypothetical protein